MSKLGVFFDKIKCGFIGWNYLLYRESYEASRQMLKIYTSALLIIMTLWFIIGIVFSQRYIGVSSTPKLILAGVIFALVVYWIEKIIILHVGGKGIYIFRIILAVCMAIVGAFIFDQIIFRNDLEEAVRQHEYKKIKQEQTDKIANAQKEIDRLILKNDSLNTIISLRPTIKVVESGTTRTGVRDSLGNEIIQRHTNIKQVDNPIIAQVSANNDLINRYVEEVSNLNRVNIDELTDNRIKNKKTGFLEELKVSVSVVFSELISTLFYGFLTTVMLCLELFVVSLKFFKGRKCDYDLMVEHQLELKRIELDDTKRKYKTQYATNTMSNSNGTSMAND